MILQKLTCCLLRCKQLINQTGSDTIQLMYILLLQWNLYNFYGHLGISHKWPGYQGVLSLYNKAPFGTITKYVDYAGGLIFKCPD